MAIAALAVSIVSLSFSAAWSIYVFRRSRLPMLRVGAVFAESTVGDIEIWGLGVFLSNTGTVPTTLRFLGLQLRRNGGFESLEGDVVRGMPPAPFVPAQTWESSIPGGTVIEALRKLQERGPWAYRLFVVDHTGRAHKSQLLQLDEPSS